MQGAESSILWSSSEDKQSLLCRGSVLSSESISSASDETKQNKNLKTFKTMRKTQNLQVMTVKQSSYWFAQLTKSSCTSGIPNNIAFSVSTAVPTLLFLWQGTMTKVRLFELHTFVLSTIWLSKYFICKDNSLTNIYWMPTMC